MPLLNLQAVTTILRRDGGFTLVEMVIVVFLIATVSAIAIPAIADIGSAIALSQSTRLVQSELQQARLKAVTTNRIMRIRFNCPEVGQFRIVELIGTPAAPAAGDTASDRCKDTVYPFPSNDTNPLTLPNHDGAIRRIDYRVSFGAVQTIEFRPNGTAYAVNADGTSTAPLPGNGVAITLTKGSDTKSVTVNALGKIRSES